jgi:hypothetical protein
MPKKYVFEFLGTKDAFLEMLDEFPHSTYGNKKIYYIDSYLIELRDNKIYFGVARAGHSGGEWFVPEVVEYDNRIEFCGTIRYIGPNDDRSRIRKIIDWIEIFLMAVLLLPIILLFAICKSIKWSIRKICHRAQPKAETLEDKLFDLMENRMGCIKNQ